MVKACDAGLPPRCFRSWGSHQGPGQVANPSLISGSPTSSSPGRRIRGDTVDRTNGIIVDFDGAWLLRKPDEYLRI